MYSPICAICDCFCVRCIHKRRHGWGVVDLVGLDNQKVGNIHLCHRVPETGLTDRAPARGARQVMLVRSADGPHPAIHADRAGMDRLLTNMDDVASPLGRRSCGGVWGIRCHVAGSHLTSRPTSTSIVNQRTAADGVHYMADLGQWRCSGGPIKTWSQLLTRAGKLLRSGVTSRVAALGKV